MPIKFDSRNKSKTGRTPEKSVIYYTEVYYANSYFGWVENSDEYPC